MARVAVIDPSGAQWRVWRRWYAWRRWLTLGDVWNGTPGTGSDRYGNSDGVDDAVSVLLFPLILIALAVSLADLALQLVVLPFILVARLVRLAGWPVQSDRAGKFVRTSRVRGFAQAGVLRDELVEQVRLGTGVADQSAPASDAA